MDVEPSQHRKDVADVEGGQKGGSNNERREKRAVASEADRLLLFSLYKRICARQEKKREAPSAPLRAPRLRERIDLVDYHVELARDNLINPRNTPCLLVSSTDYLGNVRISAAERQKGASGSVSETNPRLMRPPVSQRARYEYI